MSHWYQSHDASPSLAWRVHWYRRLLYYIVGVLICIPYTLSGTPVGHHLLTQVAAFAYDMAFASESAELYAVAHDIVVPPDPTHARYDAQLQS